MSDEICLIDTNILVYAYDKSEGKKHEICERLIDECWKLKENNIFCIYTEDGDFKGIPWLNVINPFEVTTN